MPETNRDRQARNSLAMRSHARVSSTLEESAIECSCSHRGKAEEQQGSQEGQDCERNCQGDVREDPLFQEPDSSCCSDDVGQYGGAACDQKGRLKVHAKDIEDQEDRERKPDERQNGAIRRARLLTQGVQHPRKTSASSNGVDHP